ncbi:phage tail protein [Haemophilus influenzae]|uniref:phage tail protein n=1 Tax=Haemophilus influenzae TaxID=727 RepID=UPI0010C298AD|nr:phage tail protein [Haemophilus influenzae]VTP75693.1 putative phage tail protein [Haemophilus influenzae]
MGGGGGGGGHTPYEAPEFGRSKQAVRIVEIVSEGEVKGLVNGVQSVFLDNTPIQNKDGTYNFSNVEAEGRIGIQDQDILEGFNTSEKEISVGTQVRKNTPLTRTVSDGKVSRLRLTLGVQSLFSQNDQGDTHGASVTMNITIGQRVIPLTINGKYSSQYLRQIEIDNLPPTPFTVRVERIDEDSKSQRLQNNTIWASYTEIIEMRLAYPNTALVGIKFDSDYFSSIPNRTYDVYGIIVQVPSNYNPETRAYNGTWDGTFKTAWSDNPAWVLYDLLKNKRYGFGRRLGDFAVDKWALYNVAQYCDQLVDDGFGGKEPRFTCNAWITEQRQAYDVINDICSIFRAMPVWNGREFTVIQDRPADPVWTYTNANVDKEGFTYSYSAMKARHNEIHVEYANAQNNYEKDVICVSDDDLIRRYGLNVKKVTAFGCTSRGQAYRTGRWILETEKLETRTVTFTVGAEGLMHVPGDIILVADNDYAGTQLGGRVLSVANKVVTLDREVPFKSGEQFLYYNQDAQVTGIKVIDVLDGNRIVLDKAPTGLTEYGVWLRHGEKVQPQLYRALSIKEESKGKYTITALQHEPQKEAIVDSGAHFEPVSFSEVPDRYRIQNVDVAATDDGIRLSFEYFAKNESTVKYQIKLYRTFDGNRTLYKVYDDLTNTNISFTGLPDGDYTAEIRAKNGVGQLSEPVTKSFSVNFTIAELVTVSKLMGIDLNWRNPIFANTNAAIEIWVSKDNNFANARKLITLAYPTNSYSYTGLGAAETYYFWARMVSKDIAGKFTDAVEGVTERDATKIVDYIHGQINKSALSQELVKELTNTAETARTAIAGITSETQARIATLNAEANNRAKAIREEGLKLTQKIEAESRKATVALQEEVKARGTAINKLEQADKQQAKAIEQVTAKANSALSGIEVERKARAAADNAESKAREILTAKIGQHESSINQINQTIVRDRETSAQQVATLESAVRNIRVGGRNYLLDSSFKNGKWYKSQGSGSKATIDVDNGVLTISSDNATWKQYQIKGYAHKGGLNELVDSTTVTISFEVMTPDDNTGGGIKYWMNLRADRIDNTHGGSTNPIVINQTAAPSKWSRVSITGVATQPTNFRGWRFLLGVSTPGTVKFRNPKLEVGNVATDWTPAPEDLDQSELINAKFVDIRQVVTSETEARTVWQNNAISRINGVESNIANIQRSVTTATQSISEVNQHLNAKIDGISVGGRNLLLGTAIGLSGNGAKNYQNKTYNVTSNIDVSTLKTITLSCSVLTKGIKAGNGEYHFRAGAEVQLFYADGTNGWLSAYCNDVADFNGRISKTLTLSKPLSKLTYNKVQVRNIAEGEYKVDGIKLEVGNVATDWTPAPEDVDSAIGDLSADLNHYKSAQATKDQATSMQLTTLTARMANAESGISKVEKAVSDAKSSTATQLNQLSAEFRKAKTDLDAKIEDEKTARANADRAEAEKNATMTSRVANAESKISQVSKTVADVSGKLSSTHTIKTQVVGGGRMAIAGIALGASSDGKTAESSVIVMADKFGVVKSATDGTVKNVFTVSNNQLVLSGDLLADGSIIGRHIQANQEIRSPLISGGEIDISGNDGILRVGRTGNFLVRASSQNRGLVINNDQIIVYDDRGNVRVKIGRL